MLELIRSKVMEMIKDRHLAMYKKSGPIYVKIKRILDKNMKDCVGYTHRWNCRDGYEIRAGHEQYIVNTSRAKTKQPKRRQSKKKESTVDGTVDPSPATATATIAENEDDPRPALDQKIEESSSKAVAFIPPRPAPVAENEDDHDIQIIKVVKDLNVDPALSQRETRRVKRHLTKRANEQNKKKKPS
ncbi:hypothetical protein LIER_32736 [Lithospermum erythrorhizon]|uniref:Uncharacterized protein n=1 Tax=Lithospermum erythrorhizon TaxID=34254 RepID=A0AAV3RUQ6_LITER